MLDFIRSGFNTSLGYSAIERCYMYNGKPYLGYVLVKNYTMFWIPGYDRIGVFSDRETLNQYLELNSISIIN
jgi:hypothetical protein